MNVGSIGGDDDGKDEFANEEEEDRWDDDIEFEFGA